MAFTLISVPNMGASGKIKQILTAWRTSLETTLRSLADDTEDNTLEIQGLTRLVEPRAYNADGAIYAGGRAALDGGDEALAMTLANGAPGTTQFLVCSDATNNCVVTPANLSGGSTLTFDAVGEYALLIFDGTNWNIIANTATLA